MLNTEKNTPEMEQRILAAANAHDETLYHSGPLTADFEHGQWWVSCLLCGAQWSACDAEGGPAVDGFDFECVTQGDDSCEEE